MFRSPRRRRVVVTGMAMITPLGLNKEETFANLCAGKTGTTSLYNVPFFLPEHIDAKPSHDPRAYTEAEKEAILRKSIECLPCQVAAPVPSFTRLPAAGQVGSANSTTTTTTASSKEATAGPVSAPASPAAASSAASPPSSPPLLLLQGRFTDIFPPTPREPRSFAFCRAAARDALADAGLLDLLQYQKAYIKRRKTEMAKAAKQQQQQPASSSSASNNGGGAGKKTAATGAASFPSPPLPNPHGFVPADFIDPATIGVHIGMGMPSLMDISDVASFFYPNAKALGMGMGQTGGGGTTNTTTNHHNNDNDRSHNDNNNNTSSNGGTPDYADYRPLYNRINPFFVPKILGNMPSGVISMEYGLTGDIGSSVAACATGQHCIDAAYRAIQRGADCEPLSSRDFQNETGASTSAASATSATAAADMIGAGADKNTNGGSSDGGKEEDEMEEPAWLADESAEGLGANIMICGATESCINSISLGGFARMRALSTKYNNAESPRDAGGATEGPAAASRPFDEKRGGFVMGEGCGLLVLEDYDHALRRRRRALARQRRLQKKQQQQEQEQQERNKESGGSAASPDVVSSSSSASSSSSTPPPFRIYAELVGSGVSADAHDVAAPHPDGAGAARCLRRCLADAGLPLYSSPSTDLYGAAHASREEEEEEAEKGMPVHDARQLTGAAAPLLVGYVNAHATGTKGDPIELSAIQRVFRTAAPAADTNNEAAAGSAADNTVSGGAAAAGGCSRDVSPPPIVVSSSKGALGHLLGAAGAVESIVTVMALHRRAIPPTANLQSPVWTREEQRRRGIVLAAGPGALPFPTLDSAATAAGTAASSSAPSVDSSTDPAKKSVSEGSACAASSLAPPPAAAAPRVRLAAVSNSFGFGGVNSALLFAEVPGEEM